jgi:hypothetical protein
MSNTALQSLVKKQSLETEKFNANLVPPIQTVVLVSNVQGYKEEEEGGRGGGGGVSGGVQVGITGSSSSSTILTSNNDHGSSSFSSSSSSSSTAVSLKSQSLLEAIQQPNELNTLKHSNDIDGEDDDEELEEEIVPESIQEELRRLENTIREEHETSERIMAQNIALLADLEVAQRMVRELKAGKNALALQLRNALQSAENR